MEELSYLWRDHSAAVIVTAIILGIVLWAWICIRIAAYGDVVFNMKFVRSKSMLCLVLAVVVFGVMIGLWPKTCTQPCDLDTIQHQHLVYFHGGMALLAFIALILNVRRSNVFFGFIFTLAQSSVAVIGILLLIIVMMVRGDALEHKAKVTRAREKALGL